MANLNNNEIGQVIRVNAGKDITSATITLILLPERGEKKEITTGITVGSVDFNAGGETYLANEYIEYTTVDEDLDYTGRWKKKIQMKFSASNVEQTDYEKFRVLA